MDEILQEFLSLVESGEEIDEELLDLIDQLLSSQETSIEPPPPTGTDLLWILSGENPQVFTEYLTTFPDPALNALARDPSRLQNVIESLGRKITQPAGEVEDGIPKQPLNSSNIFGFSYNPKDGSLKVRFNSGSVYSFSGVPAHVFKMFQSGAIPAKTNGQNNFGKWWIGKRPSSGASFYELIRDKFPYKRLK